MKTIKIFLGLLALIAVKTNAQQSVVVNASNDTYAAVSVKSTVSVNQDVESGADAERSKSFSKTFSVDNSDKVNLNNQYGSITIKTWDRKTYINLFVPIRIIVYPAISNRYPNLF